MRVERTERGFELVAFIDRYGKQCSLQQSSLAEYESPGSSAVWLGIDDHRMHLDEQLVGELLPLLERWLETGSFCGDD